MSQRMFNIQILNDLNINNSLNNFNYPSKNNFNYPSKNNFNYILFLFFHVETQNIIFGKETFSKFR